MIQFGNFNQLNVVAIDANGVMLDGLNAGQIYLAPKEAPTNCKVGDSLSVFVFLDAQDRPTATTIKPLIQVGEFASLKVNQVNKIGAFLDWGLPKDLLVPFNQQKTKMEADKRYIVRAYLDARTQRIAASSFIDKYLDIWPASYVENQEVKVLIAGKTDLGFKVIVNDAHWGLIYENEIFKPIRTGLMMIAYVKKVRQDGRIDLSLSKPGLGKVRDFSDDLLAYLHKNKGFCPLGDSSSPEQIQFAFGVSKKTFKKAVGHLLKLEKIKLLDAGFELVS